jgi:alkanesulfonate monooxygenase SsuD/methylene tetrahydromethanopterin reductase-like flavin-dependent oxidoreductase (luciferase family)
MSSTAWPAASLQQEGVAFMKELVPAVQKLWAGDYAHDGHYWKFPLATSVPKPLQQPHPPIWVAARDPGTFDWAVGIGANILSTPLSCRPPRSAFSAKSSARPWPTIPRSPARAHDAAPDLRL